jgi:hypothetical protein
MGNELRERYARETGSSVLSTSDDETNSSLSSIHQSWLGNRLLWRSWGCRRTSASTTATDDRNSRGGRRQRAIGARGNVASERVCVGCERSDADADLFVE